MEVVERFEVELLVLELNSRLGLDLDLDLDLDLKMPIFGVLVYQWPSSPICFVSSDSVFSARCPGSGVSMGRLIK